MIPKSGYRFSEKIMHQENHVRKAMAVYTVHEPPRRNSDPLAHTTRFAFVRDGFSWPAFLFGPFWMLWHRLWLALIGYLLLAAAIAFALRAVGAGGEAGFFAALLFALLVGFEAPSLRRYGLNRRRWKNLGVVIGDDREAAERRFFDAWVGDAAPRAASMASPSPPSASAPAYAATPASSGIIGLFPEPGARA